MVKSNSVTETKYSGSLSHLDSFNEKVYRVVRRIPKGKLMTYGQVAVAAGRPLAARAVGNALHRNPHPDVPCHRVVNARGRLAPNFGKGGWKEQENRLRAEGVEFRSNQRVDLKKGLDKGVWKHAILK